METGPLRMLLSVQELISISKTRFFWSFNTSWHLFNEKLLFLYVKNGDTALNVAEGNSTSAEPISRTMRGSLVAVFLRRKLRGSITSSTPLVNVILKSQPIALEL